MPEKLTFAKFNDPPPGARFGNPKFKCLQCEDTGFATIWHPDTIQRAKSTPDERFRWKVCAVLCDCESALRKGQAFPGSKRDVPTLGDEPWHIVANGSRAKAEAFEYVHRPRSHLGHRKYKPQTDNYPVLVSTQYGWVVAQ